MPRICNLSKGERASEALPATHSKNDIGDFSYIFERCAVNNPLPRIPTDRGRGVALKGHMAYFFTLAIWSMSLFSRLECLLNRHDPLRRNVKWDGMTYVGDCRHCGETIVRISRGKWRKLVPTDPETDSTAI
jgi:hypothetical protein